MWLVLVVFIGALLLYTPRTRVAPQPANQWRFLLPNSGCHMMDWVVGEQDCYHIPARHRLTAKSKVRPNATVYVEYSKVPYFVDKLLPRIQVPIVLVTGQEALVGCCDIIDIRGFGTQATEGILSSPRVLHWYTMNPWFRHPKVSGWPYGLNPGILPAYAAAFKQPVYNKTKGLLLTSLGLSHRPWRKGVPQGPHLNSTTYLRALSQHQYVLSPNGDRPDCYRNYEALGMGTVPVTELDPYLYDFFQGTGVLFAQDVHNWKVPADINRSLTRRSVVFEQYWADRLQAAIAHGTYRLAAQPFVA